MNKKNATTNAPFSIKRQLNQDKDMALVTDTTLAHTYFQKGISVSKRQEFDSGAYYFALSREIFRQHDLWEKYIDVSAYLVLNLIYLDKIDSASQINQHLITIFEQKQLTDTVTLKKLLNYQGGIYSITKKLDSAIIVTRKLLTLDKLSFNGKPDMLLGGTYHNLGTLYTDYEMLDKALQYYDSAETIYYQFNAKETEEAARLYSNKAIVLKLLGNYEESLTFNKHSYEIFASILKPDHPRLALALFNIGNDLIDRNKGTQDNLEGIHYLNLGFEVLKRGKNLSHRYITDYYRFMAKAYTNLENFSLAQAHLEKALSKSIELLGEKNVEQAHIYEELSNVYTHLRSYDTAQDYLDKSKQIYESRLSGDFIGIANIYNLKGLLFAKQEKYDEALKSYQKALSYFVPDMDTTDIFNNPDRAALVTHENFFSILKNKAEALNNAFQVHPTTAYLEAAFATYSLLDAYVQTSRKHFFDSNVKLEFTENKSDFFENSIETGILLYQKTHQQKVLDKTLQLADHHTSILLLEVLENNKAKMFANLPPTLAEKEQDLKGAITYTQQSLFTRHQENNDEENKKSIKELEVKLFNLKTDFEVLIKTIEQQYPAYHQLKYQQEALDMATLRLQVGKEAALLQYFVGERNIYAWVLHKNQTDYVKIPKPNDFEAEIQAFLNSLKHRDFHTYASKGYALYQMLLEPVLTKLNNPTTDHLLIIPDGILGYLPFETLIQSNPANAKGYKELNYLIKDYEISYHYSASLLTFEQPQKPHPPNTFIGFAPSFRDDTDQQWLAFNETVRSYIDSARALPYAEEEVNTIAALLEGNAYTGASATERSFKQDAGNYNIIHLASHSIVNDADPLYSQLIFDNENDSIEDGLLHTYELYNMHLNADLVTLSACNTGVGKYYQGEGIVSLARGFMYAGVPNVMMSLWSVADRPTKDIMEYFYTELNQGTSYATALHKAKLRYLQNSDNLTADPYYWGAFIFLGQMHENTPSLSGKVWWGLGIALAIALITIGAILWKRKYHLS